jgi:toxin secretion/phage lysis holin
LIKESEVKDMEKMKVMVIAVLSTLMSWLGILAVPVFLMVGCNVIDYITGIWAAKYRTENVNSYKGIRGIIKKVCMWLLVVIGAWIDILVNYAIECAGVDISFPFVVATIVAVWLVVNEMISILENMIDIGVWMPPFLLPIVKYIKKQVEEKATMSGEDEEGEDNED